jgi:hypothetical protein
MNQKLSNIQEFKKQEIIWPKNTHIKKNSDDIGSINPPLTSALPSQKTSSTSTFNPLF